MSEGVSTIEVGKSYEVCAYHKKSLTEIEMYEHKENGKKLNTEILWRNGSFLITVQNKDEAEYLQEALGENGQIWDFEDYEVCELWDTYDGCAEDFVFYGKYFDEQEQEDLEKEYEDLLDSDNWQGRYEFLTEKGYDSLGCNWQIHGGVIAYQKEPN